MEILTREQDYAQELQTKWTVIADLVGGTKRAVEIAAFIIVWLWFWKRFGRMLYGLLFGSCVFVGVLIIAKLIGK